MCCRAADTRAAQGSPLAAPVRDHGRMEFSFSNPLWRWEKRRELWTFVSLSEDASDRIAAATERFTHGFGSVRVEATVGGSTWRTSIFPSDATYILPIKKAVREAEGLELDAPVVGKVRLVDVEDPQR